MHTSIIPDFDQFVPREATDAAKYEARGYVFGTDSVQPLWVADMDLPVAPFLQEALSERIQHPCYGYTIQSSSLKEAVQWWMQEEHNVGVAPGSILFSPSVVSTMRNGIAAFTQEGDGVAVFSPVYERFYSAITLQKRLVVDIALCADEGKYHIDFAAFEQACKDEKVSMLLFCNPQNPSGRVWRREELTELVRICNQYKVFLLADEIHSDIIYPPNQHTSLYAIDGAMQNTLLAHSIGKTFNCSGLQPSFVLIGDQRIRRRFAVEAKRTHTGDINLLAKVAIQTLFSKRGVQYKHALIAYLAANRDILARRLGQLNEISMMEPQATFLAWLDFRKTGLSHREIRHKLITEAGLGLSDGLVYGSVGKGWFRLNFALSRSTLERAIAKLERVFC